MLKYGGYYPPQAEELAGKRLALRKEGRFVEADNMRRTAQIVYNVEIQDTKTGWTLRWYGGGK